MRHLLFILATMMMASCYNHADRTSDAWYLTDEQVDSISFYSTHHYTYNFNFVVKVDSIVMYDLPSLDDCFDSVVVRYGDRLVVADIEKIANDTIDSVWVKLAHDQETQGWIHEKVLLGGAAPDDPISRFIDVFSDIHLLLFLALIVVVGATYGMRKLLRRRAMIVHINDIDSPFPMTLALLVASAATIYASIQMFAPEVWRHFYYHPSLNPFTMPVILGLLISIVWAIIIIAIAAMDDIFRHLRISEAMLYMLGLGAVCAVDYILFSILTLYYVGYLCLVLYMVYAIYRYSKNSIYPYQCGNCGHKLKQKGMCPYCGVENE